jgi:sec-independent protein translocase protein TatC
MRAQNKTPIPRPITFRRRKPLPTFLDHVNELRNRLFVVVIALVLGVTISYNFHDVLVKVLLAPLKGQKLIYLTPGGGFDFIFQISLYGGLLLAIPVVMYELYHYLSPLMKVAHTRRFVAVVIFSACALAAAGILFGYFVALPAALKFLMTFAGDYVQANLTANSYLSFIIAYSLGLAALFQVPIIMLFINSISGPLPPSKLLRAERFIIVGAFIASAVLTPSPDMVNQTIMAIPIIVVYQIGVAAVLLQNRKRKLPLAKTVQKTKPPGDIAFVAPVREAGVAMLATAAMPVRRAGTAIDGVQQPISRQASAVQTNAPDIAFTSTQSQTGTAPLDNSGQQSVSFT